MLVRVHRAVSAPVSGRLFNPEDDPKPGVLVPVKREFAVASGPSDVPLELLGTLNQASSQCVECDLALFSVRDWTKIHIEAPIGLSSSVRRYSSTQTTCWQSISPSMVSLMRS